MGSKTLNIPATTVKPEVILLRGGLDEGPPLSLKPGVLRRAENVEALAQGGYGRIKGYERTDGRPNPSDAVYGTLLVSSNTANIGDTIEGDDSGTTAVVIDLGLNVGGSGNDALVYTKATGSFDVDGGEALVAGGTIVGVYEGDGSDTEFIEYGFARGGVGGDDLDVNLLAIAANEYRDDIGAVPGSGDVRGVMYIGGICYAFRNNADATELHCYKQSSSGWTLVPMLNTISFTLGTSEYSDGETLSKGGASATIKRVCLESGTWAGGTAAGKMVIGTVTGGPFTAGVSGGGGAATLSGASTALVLLPGGQIEHDAGVVGTARRTYAVDGVNKAFEFDGEVIAPIYNSGNSPDIPSHVLVHSGHLLLSYSNSVQCSAIGNPFGWATADGAAEYLMQADVTVMKRLQGAQETAVAAIFTDAGMQVLYGSSAADFKPRNYEDSAGAKERSGQVLGRLYTLDDRGVMEASATQAFGNFSTSSMSLSIPSFIRARRNSVTDSLVNREKSQYRLFFSDGYGLYMTVAGGKLIGHTTVRFPDVVKCCCTGEAPDGTEFSFFGSADGFVYRLDAGTSFDGEVIDFDAWTNPAHDGNPTQNKRYRRVSCEVEGQTYARFSIAAEFAYGNVDRAQSDVPTEDAIYPLTAGRWDGSGTWDGALAWDGRTLAPAYVPIDGTGENVSFRIFGSSDAYDAFSINSLIVTHSPRRAIRGGT